MNKPIVHTETNIHTQLLTTTQIYIPQKMIKNTHTSIQALVYIPLHTYIQLIT